MRRRRSPGIRTRRRHHGYFTHAGHGTLIKALAAGVPCLCMPEGRDQRDNARRARLRGSSLVLKRTASPARIADRVRTLLDDPSYRENAGHLCGLIRADADRSILLEELENLHPAVQQ
ncbi:nucleotide disphospho-sugar-binding domain-containing protein [Arthrobacter sp. Br18]|uniref:glycosyltransferase n=1 Tax=Arthrobacter sp. Br18 TaxID=1312954 RepID=UPI0012DE4B58|nr:nucleotide disphospho-sugar-binding domain-containing protein [Arthrobacter sp. Br18]